MSALCCLCCLGVVVSVCACWPWGFSDLSVVMLGPVVTCMFDSCLISLLVVSHLVLSAGESVASVD